MIDINKLQSLHEAATPEPWAQAGAYAHVFAVDTGDPTDIGAIIGEVWHNTRWRTQQKDNVALIVSIRNALPDIIDELQSQKITGETSDGYHTFNELYHHRAVLFCAVCDAHRSKAWKSKKHHDGTMFDGMFIVSIDTTEGQATYHYDIDPYWDMFAVEELENAPEWDGHTSDDAITRIGSMDGCEVERMRDRLAALETENATLRRELHMQCMTLANRETYSQASCVTSEAWAHAGRAAIPVQRRAVNRANRARVAMQAGSAIFVGADMTNLSGCCRMIGRGRL